MKTLKIIFGIFITLLGLAMITLSWIFFFWEETEIIVLACLYLALFISAIVMAIGIFVLLHLKEE